MLAFAERKNGAATADGFEHCPGADVPVADQEDRDRRFNLGDGRMRQGHVDGLDVSVDDHSHPCAGEDFVDVLNRLTAERVLGALQIAPTTCCC